MNKIQIQNMKMIQGVKLMLDDTATVWSANAAFTDSYNKLKDYLDKISEHSMNQGNDNSGYTETKSMARTALTANTSAISKIAVYYSVLSSNTMLRTKARITDTQLKQARTNELTGLAEQVLQAAAEFEVQLLPLGLTHQMLVDQQTFIDDYNKWVSQPDGMRSENKNATASLAQVSRQAMNFMRDDMDWAVGMFLSNSLFQTRYKISRRVQRGPRRHRALELTVTAIDSGEPLAKAKLHIKDASLRRRTSLAGIARVQNIAEGKHTLTVTLKNYKPREVEFVIAKGERNFLKVEMERE